MYAIEGVRAWLISRRVRPEAACMVRAACGGVSPAAATQRLAEYGDDVMALVRNRSGCCARAAGAPQSFSCHGYV
jgi:hypothetical protein